jgi:serine protease
VGFFFLRSRFGPSASGSAFEIAFIPIPDWQDIIFGRGKRANPLFYSALIPLVLSFLAIKFTHLRPVIAGLAIGFAGFLVYALWSRAPALSYLPFTFLAIPWLGLNAIICLFISRAMLRKEPA